MRHQYLYLDPALIQAILAGLDLLRLFNQLVLATGGDVEEAMDWMRYLQAAGASPRGARPRSLLRQPGGPEHGRAATARAASSSPPAASGAIRRSAFEEIFSTLDRSGPGYHPIRAAGEGIERLPETRPYSFGDDIHLLDSARSLQNAFKRNNSGGRGRRLQPRRGGPGGLRDRAPDLLRHGGGHRHQPLDDPLRRGPHHPGQDRGPGPDRADHHQVSRRTTSR